MLKRPNIDDDQLLTQNEVARRWRCSLRKLQRLRANGDGPTFVQLGGSIRYHLTDLLDFEDSNRMGGR